MQYPIFIAMLAAIISPVIFGLMNTVDKYVIAHKVRKPLGFAVVAGAVTCFLGIILALFLDWNGIAIKQMIAPAIAGIFMGSQFFVYYLIIKKEDISSMIGLLYIYPVIVTVLSFFFLHEVISFVGYIGVGFILTGALMLSIRLKKIKLRASIWLIITLIVAVALNEFTIKIATTKLPEFNGLAVNLIFVGITVIPSLVFRGIRREFFKEIKNIRWAFLSESLTFLGIGTLYVAMKELPATFVSSVAATQPLAVLFFERFMHKRVGKMSRDNVLIHKLVPIILIAIGVVLLYGTEIIKSLGK